MSIETYVFVAPALLVIAGRLAVWWFERADREGDLTVRRGRMREPARKCGS